MKKILIVDDNKSVRKSYSTTIEEFIPEVLVITAVDEREAIHVINTTDIDVVITDLTMKNETGGIDVLNAAKKRDPLIMVIIVTAYDEKLNRTEAFDIGAFDCLGKAEEGVVTGTELVYKAKSALKFREAMLNVIKSEKHYEILRRFFDPSIFEKIQKNPEILIPQNKTVTIAFWDIRGFSSLSEKLKTSPLLISGFLKEYLEAASRIIFNHGGVLDKFIGDGIMAIFGPFDESNNAEIEYLGIQPALDATKAALELKREFGTIYLQWKKRWEHHSADTFDIGLGAGIHTGVALVGNLGTDYRDHFTAIGPHVNFAARIEKSAEKDQIRISNTTRSKIEGHFKTVHVETLSDIKNIPGTYQIFSVIT